MNVTINNAQHSLDEVRKLVKGIFKGFGSPYIELILEEHKFDSEEIKHHTLNTVRITSVGAIQRTFGLPAEKGNVYMFPNGKTLFEMLENPREYEEFCKEHKF